MKCPRCLSVCLEDDPICFACHHPLSAPARAWAIGRGTQASRMALIMMIFGACLGPVICQAFFPGMSRELFDFNSLAFAGTGAALGAMIGYALGGFVGGPDDDGGPTLKSRARVVQFPHHIPGDRP